MDNDRDLVTNPNDAIVPLNSTTRWCGYCVVGISPSLSGGQAGDQRRCGTAVRPHAQGENIPYDQSRADLTIATGWCGAVDEWLVHFHQTTNTDEGSTK